MLLGIGTLGLGAISARADDLCAVFNKEKQSATTSADAIARLKQGNARFVAGRTIHCNPQPQVRLTAHGQAPFAAILGCMDSRVSPELVFDQRIGDIFAVRIAGNFVDTEVSERNAQDAAAHLVSRSEVLAHAISDGKLSIVAAMHDVTTGVVSWIEAKG